MKLYAFASEDAVRAADGDPHAVVLELSPEDHRKFGDQRDRERVSRYEIGKYVSVTDTDTGERWRVASAPCGIGCHCAAVAEKEATMNEEQIKARLEELRIELREERISWGGLADLQGLAEHIEPGDVELLEPAGVPEFSS